MHDGRADVVLARDELERCGLALRLPRENGGNFRVGALHASEHASRDVIEVGVRGERLGLGRGGGWRGGGHGTGLRDRHARDGRAAPGNAIASLRSMRRPRPLVRTPVGRLAATVRTNGSVDVRWSSERATRTRACRAPAAGTGAAAHVDLAATARLANRIAQWIAGDMGALRGAPLPSGTPWQRACWSAARRIPAGQTRTYLWLAQQACRALGRPQAHAHALARAAGQAMRRNPAPLVVPCHRVVSAHGMGGYAGSDNPRSVQLARKRWLLALESRARASP